MPRFGPALDLVRVVRLVPMSSSVPTSPGDGIEIMAMPPVSWPDRFHLLRLKQSRLGAFTFGHFALQALERIVTLPMRMLRSVFASLSCKARVWRALSG
jgi:hypothetical protein